MTDFYMFLLLEIALFLAYQAGWYMFKKYGWEEAHFHGPHVHRCACGNTWQHDDRDLPVGRYEEALQESHTCDRCGTSVFEIFEHAHGAT